MKTSIRTRLSISHLGVLLVGIVLAGFLVWMAVEQVYLATQRDNLLAQARLTAAALQGSPLIIPESESYSQTTNLAPGIHTRLLDESGAVIIGVPFPDGEDPVQVPSWEDPGFVASEDLLKRSEIQAALAGLAETAIRQPVSGSDRRVLYAAAPVLDELGNVTSLVYLATPLPRNGLPDDLARQLAAGVIGGVVLAGIIGLLLARRISQPLEELDQAAAAISRGDLSQRIFREVGIKELDNLSSSFNAMRSNLKNSIQAKNSFIADVTHELRTPLTVIKGSVDTLEDGALDDLDGRDQLLSSLGNETNRLIRLVNNLLTLTRADADALQLKPHTFDLRDLVNERCQGLIPIAAPEQVTLVPIPPGSDQELPPLVFADRDRISQVIDNILDNAIRYAPAGTEIKTALQFFPGAVQCTITDQGPGIAAEHLPFIFERFYRVDPARDRETGGAGLGLAIARSLIEVQGGKIEAVCPSSGGTAISFLIPAGPPGPKTG